MKPTSPLAAALFAAIATLVGIGLTGPAVIADLHNRYPDMPLKPSRAHFVAAFVVAAAVGVIAFFVYRRRARRQAAG